ncbi:DUF883 family protein [Tateyamaria sp. SN6-1]|uniref:DUF883 family protein n=1 Tax=Tateyamaria sp. SN6-1 TaxID=3092148 RepID=UPI0039F5DDB4
MTAKASEWADTARQQAETLRDTVGSAAKDGREVLHSAAHDLEAKAKHAQDTALSTVRRNPGLAVAGAVGFGVLLGLALGRRN